MGSPLPTTATGPRSTRCSPGPLSQNDRVTLHGVRNFDYRSETDFTPRYEDRTYDLAALDSVDLVASYWMGEAIAHVMLSFGFGGEDFVAISIETRRERTEGYSTVKGFFKQYELFYVVADERDLIRLRTNYRENPPEDVYVYRTKGRPEAIRRVFLDYLREINELAERPRWYNTLTTNCTTAIMTHLRVNPDHAPMSWKVLLSGYAPQYAWERGALDTRLPFEELKARSRINDVAQAADQAPDFSQRIREGLPVPRRRRLRSSGRRTIDGAAGASLSCPRRASAPTAPSTRSLEHARKEHVTMSETSTRRSFLRTASVAGAALATGPAILRGATGGEARWCWPSSAWATSTPPDS